MTPLRRLASIDLGALARNIESLHPRPLLLDASADAYGHGALRVASVAQACGIRSVGVRNDGERSVLTAAGFVCEVMSSDRLAGSDARVAYGVASGLGPFPVMRVSARVTAVKTIDAGEPVSYGYTWRASARTNLALLPVGYADGLSRSASNRGVVWCAGALRPIVGRVAMNAAVLDLGDDRVLPGAEAVLFGDHDGEGVSVQEWAGTIGADPLDVTASLGAHVPRRWT